MLFGWASMPTIHYTVITVRDIHVIVLNFLCKNSLGNNKYNCLLKYNEIQLRNIRYNSNAIMNLSVSYETLYRMRHTTFDLLTGLQNNSYFSWR